MENSTAIKLHNMCYFLQKVTAGKGKESKFRDPGHGNSHFMSRGRVPCAVACTGTRPPLGPTRPSCTQRAPSPSGKNKEWRAFEVFLYSGNVSIVSPPDYEIACGLKSHLIQFVTRQWELEIDHNWFLLQVFLRRGFWDKIRNVSA